MKKEGNYAGSHIQAHRRWTVVADMFVNGYTAVEIGTVLDLHYQHVINTLRRQKVWPAGIGTNRDVDRMGSAFASMGYAHAVHSKTGWRVGGYDPRIGTTPQPWKGIPEEFYRPGNLYAVPGGMARRYARAAYLPQSVPVVLRDGTVVQRPFMTRATKALPPVRVPVVPEKPSVWKRLLRVFGAAA